MLILFLLLVIGPSVLTTFVMLAQRKNESEFIHRNIVIIILVLLIAGFAGPWLWSRTIEAWTYGWKIGFTCIVGLVPPILMILYAVVHGFEQEDKHYEDTTTQRYH